MPQKNIQRRFFIAAMGPGEIGQGMAFARYAIDRGDRVIFSVPSPEYLSLARIKQDNFSSIVTKNSASLRKAIRDNKPDALILCNSKIFTRNDNFVENPPDLAVPSLSIDSNWLFSPSSPYIFNPWVDRYCINFPEPIFKLGLKKNGGHYSIPKKTFKKIKVVGLIPSYRPLLKKEKEAIRKKYGIGKGEKLIFLYFSMGYLTKPAVLIKLYEAVKKLRLKGRKIKVVNFTNKPNGIIDSGDRNWFIILPLTNADIFSKTLASSDLIFQHQGLSTLEQAIGMRIPVIANVRNLEDEKNPDRHRHSWEVGPFARYGACSMFFIHDSVSRVAGKIEELLYDSGARKNMRNKQRLLYKKGEAAVYEEAIKLMKK